MVPYIIQRGEPSYDCFFDENVITTFFSCENDNLNREIIKNINEFMHEFSSKEWCNFDIISYFDFYDTYWLEFEIRMKEYFPYVFKIHYFEDNIWKRWNVEDHMKEIYSSYVINYKNSK